MERQGGVGRPTAPRPLEAQQTPQAIKQQHQHAAVPYGVTKLEGQGQGQAIKQQHCRQQQAAAAAAVVGAAASGSNKTNGSLGGRQHTPAAVAHSSRQ